jgi:hypothetical protein
LVAAVALATAAAVLSGVEAMSTLTLARLATAVGAAAALAVYLWARERRRHERAEEQLATQAAFLESLVESTRQIASTLDAQDVLRRACREAERLFGARASLVDSGDSAPRNGGALTVPLRVRDEEVATLRLERDEPFERAPRCSRTSPRARARTRACSRRRRSGRPSGRVCRTS